MLSVQGEMGISSLSDRQMGQLFVSLESLCRVYPGYELPLLLWWSILNASGGPQCKKSIKQISRERRDNFMPQCRKRARMVMERMYVHGEYLAAHGALSQSREQAWRENSACIGRTGMRRRRQDRLCMRLISPISRCVTLRVPCSSLVLT
jgi:hypothetical protein